MLDVSADSLLIDVVTQSTNSVTNDLSELLKKLPLKEKRKILKAVKILVEE